MTLSKNKILPLLFFLFYVVVCLFLNFVIPPFQNPDEPQHFTIAMVYAFGEEWRDEVEAGVIQLMDKYNWWRHVGMGRPARLPNRLTQIHIIKRHVSGEDFRALHNYILFYHFLLGKTMGVFIKKEQGIEGRQTINAMQTKKERQAENARRDWIRRNLENFYYVCRLISTIFIAGALLLLFLSLKKIAKRLRGRDRRRGGDLDELRAKIAKDKGSKQLEVVGDNECRGINEVWGVNGVRKDANIKKKEGKLEKQKFSLNYNNYNIWPAFLFVLCLPQFLLSAISVNSDALAILLGGVFFYAAVSLIGGEIRPVYFLLLFFSSVIGVFTDRSVFVLIGLATANLFFLIKREKYKESIVNLLAFLTASLMLAGIIINIFPLQIERSLSLFGRNIQNLGQALPGLFSLAEFNQQFFSTIMDSFFLKFGWAIFGLGAGFYLLWRLVVTISIGGVFVFVGRMGWSWLRDLPSEIEKLEEKVGERVGIKKLKLRRKFRKKRWTKRWTRGHVKDRAKDRLKDGVEDRVKVHVKSKVSANGFLFKLTFFSLIAVFLQLIAVWTYYGSHEILAQGRHFFPLIIPIAFLFDLGLRRFLGMIRSGLGEIVERAVVVLEFIVLNFVIWGQMVPYFHLIIKNPYPGI